MKTNFIMKKNDLISLIFIVVLVFFISLWLLEYYFLGDQVNYIGTYSALSDMSLIEAYKYYNNALDSKEYIHFLLT